MQGKKINLYASFKPITYQWINLDQCDEKHHQMTLELHCNWKYENSMWNKHIRK